jgi:hypothetical protein
MPINERNVVILVAFNALINIAFTVASTLFQLGVIGEPCTWAANRLPPGPNQGHVVVIVCGTFGIVGCSFILIAFCKGFFSSHYELKEDFIAHAFGLFCMPLVVLQLGAILGGPVSSKNPDHVCDSTSEQYFLALSMTLMVVTAPMSGIFGVFLGEQIKEIEIYNQQQKTNTINTPLLSETKQEV